MHAHLVRHTDVQLRELRHLVLDAWLNVPMYRSLFDAAGISARELENLSDLTRLPVTTKSLLLATPIEQRTSRLFDSSRLIRESTTGSTGQPFSLYIDRRYLRLRNLRFLRGLIAAGYRPWHRLMLLTDRHQDSSRRFNWHYQSVERPIAELVESYRKVRPDVLYGFATPLRLLADCLRKTHAKTSGPLLVISTAEMLDAESRQRLQAVFRCPVVDFYGMTEMGLVAWQRPGANEYIMSSRTLIELVGDATCRGRYRMVMTNLDLRASPIIRFDTGDLVHVDDSGGRPRITAFEGRQIDSILCEDGTEVSPYAVTDALRNIPGVQRFKITQHELNVLDVELEVGSSLRDEAMSRISLILKTLLGNGIELSFAIRDDLSPPGTLKFRPVESRVSRP
jgi:phenylacetate-CoA ligase